ncbi:MAG TPA: NAD(P)-dependent oxidoreductase [Phycisphaerae bacterium]|nr:NAD(P)-dependent oxidoreductase [Phycisphaerae bacterium]
MRVAVTGATGFLGRYIVNHLLGEGHSCRGWVRTGGDRGGFVEAGGRLEWVDGQLGDEAATETLVAGVDAVVHSALHRPGAGFRGAEGDLIDFVQTNVLGTLRLIMSARAAAVGRFVFISTCAVHEVILDDRKLDEAHPLWPGSHYGAHKAAIEKFVHSFGFGEGYGICSLRPTGIYGLRRPAEQSKWYVLVKDVAAGKPIIDSAAGGKEVHAADVAKAVGILLTAAGVAGQCYNCCDMYISDQMVAQIAKDITGSQSKIAKVNRGPKHQIDTSKLQALGMQFGGRTLLAKTVKQLLDA